jgi:hypothetical protein
LVVHHCLVHSESGTPTFSLGLPLLEPQRELLRAVSHGSPTFSLWHATVSSTVNPLVAEMAMACHCLNHSEKWPTH